MLLKNLADPDFGVMSVTVAFLLYDICYYIYIDSITAELHSST
jgi:hypothetical protein